MRLWLTRADVVHRAERLSVSALTKPRDLTITHTLKISVHFSICLTAYFYAFACYACSPFMFLFFGMIVQKKARERRNYILFLFLLWLFLLFLAPAILLWLLVDILRRLLRRLIFLFRRIVCRVLFLRVLL